jgi:hypothetical protein
MWSSESWNWYRAIWKWLLFPVLKCWQDFALGYRKVPYFNTVNKYMFWCLYLLYGGLKKCNKYLCCAYVQGWVKHSHKEIWCFCKFTTQTLKYLKQSAAQWCEVLWEWKLLSNIYSKTVFFFFILLE